MPNSKRRRKAELQPITYDELLSSSSMSGLISFLEVQPATPGSAEDPESEQANSGAPTVGAPSRRGSADDEHRTQQTSYAIIPFPGLVSPGPSVSKTKIGADATIGVPNADTPDCSAELDDPSFKLEFSEILYRGRPELRETRYAQDGH